MRQTMEKAVVAVFSFAWMVVVVGFIAAIAVPPTVSSDEIPQSISVTHGGLASTNDPSRLLPTASTTASIENNG
jgi:hypothetical protein